MMTPGGQEEERSRTKIELLHQFVPHSGVSASSRKSPQGTSPGASSSSGPRVVQEALDENNTRLNPFGRSAAHYRVGSLVGRAE